MRFSLLQSLCEIPVAVVDTETTGASVVFGHRVTEVGVVRVEGGKVVAEYQQLVDPQRPISMGVTALTGISNDMVHGQPTFAAQLPAMLRCLEGAAVVGHNVGFDVSFLNAEFRRARVDLVQAIGPVPVLDTVRIARRRFGRGGNGLATLASRLGIDPGQSHRALADAKTTLGVLEKLLEPGDGWRTSLCDALLLQGGPIDLAGAGRGDSLLPLELEEALEAGRGVMMEYLDARGARTRRAVRPLHVRRHNGELLLVAHCQLRDDRRTFKVDRIVSLSRLDADPGDSLSSPPAAGL